MWTLILIFTIIHTTAGHAISKRETVVNKIIDDFLADFNTLAYDGDMYRVQVNDLDTTFSWRKNRFVNLKGSFSASDGYVEDMSTVQRTGDAILVATPSTITISAHLGLRQLDVYYAKSQVNLEGIRVSGDVKLNVEHSSVFANFTFIYEDEETCSSRLNNFFVEQLDGITVEASYGSRLGWAYEKILESLVRRFKDEIQEKVENYLAKVFQERNSKVKVCEYVRYI